MTSPKLESRLPHVGTTIFTVMTQLAQECAAINLSQGFPDFAVPEPLLHAVTHHLHAGRNQYPPMTGVAELREAIARKVLDCYDAAVDPVTDVTVTSGATEALFCAIAAVVRSGDEVVVFDPSYDSYRPAVELNGGVTVHVPLREDDFSVDWDAVDRALNARTRLIIVNTPHNPSGAVWSADDMAALATRVGNRAVFLLSDEVYEHIIFDGHRHESILRYPELAARAFVVSSFGKTFHATGWKVGYCVAPPALSAEFRKIHQYITFATVTPMQYALADFLRDHPEQYRSLPAFYQAKRDLFCRLLQGSRWRYTPAAGTYFQLLRYDALADLDDIDYARKLTREAGIASIPISVFYREPPNQHVLRFCFAKDDSTLERAAGILRDL